MCLFAGASPAKTVDKADKWTNGPQQIDFKRFSFVHHLSVFEVD